MTTETPATPVTVEPVARRVASKKAAAKKAPTPKKAATKRAVSKKRAKPKKAAAPAKSKTEIIIALVGKKSGATLAAIMAATGWQAHSVRGFISLAVSKRGLNIKSEKNAAGDRVYRIGKGK